MALPKIKLPPGRFSLKGIVEDIERKLQELVAPLDLDGPKREETGYQGAPGPVEWDEVSVKVVGEEAETGPVGITARKVFPEKKVEPKRMHRPRAGKPQIMGKRIWGKLQKNL